MVQDRLAGRHLVVTGFTGFVAKVMVALVLEEVPDLGRVTVLVRSRSERRSARARVEEAFEQSPVFRALRRAHGADLGAWLGRRLHVVHADLEQPDCDLSASDRRALETADAIVHCAGLTDFAPDPRKALSANVAAADHVARLAVDLGVPMVHVSTAFAAGRREGAGEQRVAESLTPGIAPNGAPLEVGTEIRQLELACRQPGVARRSRARIDVGMARARALGWPNIYTYTKGLAEHLLASRPGLDLTLVRPTIVECARAYPFPGWNEGMNTAGPLAWLISTAFRRLPTAPAHRFDVVPVDDVARGLVAITAAAIEGRAGGLFHLASSDHHPFTFDRAVELTGLGMRRWARRHGSAFERDVLAQLDPVPVPDRAKDWLSVDRMASWMPRLREALDRDGDVRRRLPALLDGALGERLDALSAKLLVTEGKLRRIQALLDLFRPFIQDTDWVFHSDRVRALTAGEDVFRFDLSDLCWREYWVDVEYPGLRTWCMPLIERRPVPTDPPLSPPLRLVTPPDVRMLSVDPELRVASK